MIHKGKVLQMFDSSKCLKAEAFLVSTANTLQKKKSFQINFRFKNKIKFLTKVVPTRFSKQISNIGDKCRSSLHSPHFLRVPSRAGTDAHLGGSLLI